MEAVHNSIMCLLENPTGGVKKLKEFINDENSDITSRFYFLPWANNPFDHQRRSFDLCNATLDCHPCNGHATTMDALCAGDKHRIKINAICKKHSIPQCLLTLTTL